MKGPGLRPFKVSSPLVVHIEGGLGTVLLLALKSPRVYVSYPPREGEQPGEASSGCGRFRYSYTYDVPEVLADSPGLSVYADLASALSAALVAQRLCVGSTSISEALEGSRLPRDVEALAYAISLGGAVLARRSGAATVFLGRWQVPNSLRVIMGGGPHEGAVVDVTDLLPRALRPGKEGEVLCRCRDPRLRVWVEVVRGTPKGEGFITEVDNEGSVAHVG